MNSKVLSGNSAFFSVYLRHSGLRVFIRNFAFNKNFYICSESEITITWNFNISVLGTQSVIVQHDKMDIFWIFLFFILCEIGVVVAPDREVITLEHFIQRTIIHEMIRQGVPIPPKRVSNLKYFFL